MPEKVYYAKLIISSKRLLYGFDTIVKETPVMYIGHMNKQYRKNQEEVLRFGRDTIEIYTSDSSINLKDLLYHELRKQVEEIENNFSV